MIEERVGRLESLWEIRQLVARYCFAIDNRDLAAVGALFAEDAVFRSKDGMMEARGVPAILRQFEGRFAVLGVSNHITHDHVIDLDGEQATGLVSAHAEVWRKGEAQIAALRYADCYARIGGRWLFRERVLSFLYYVPVADYAAVLGRRERNLAYDKPMPADYPESLPTWPEP